MYPCTNCNHNFATKQALQKHGERKVSCIVEAEKEKTCECKYCHKMFRFASNRCKHYKCCKMKPQEVKVEEVNESMGDDEILALVKSLNLNKDELEQRLMSNNKTVQNELQTPPIKISLLDKFIIGKLWLVNKYYIRELFCNEL